MSETAAAKDIHLSLKVMINKEQTKVLFAEADSDFTDILLSFLTLPLGRIVKLLETHYSPNPPVLGSITSLYKSLSNLENSHFTSSIAKNMLLNPRSSLDSKCCKLKLDVTESCPNNFFICGESLCFYRPQTVLMYSDVTGVCECGKALDKEGVFVEESSGAFTLETASFVILDDLRMVPYSSIGFFQTLVNMGVTEIEGAELRSVTFGTNEVMDLLKCSLFSKTPLSDVVLRKGEVSSRPTLEIGLGYFLHLFKEEETNKSNKKATLKVMVHKSTRKVLFAQADDDFVELLCNILVLPVGGVESIFENNTCLKNLDNLHKSISDMRFDKYFITLDTKKRLMNPEIPLFYKPKNTPHLKEEVIPEKLYFSAKPSVTFSRRRVADYEPIFCSFRSPRGKQNYVKEPTTYMVTDDLTLTPFRMSSSFSILNQMNVPLSDVDELEVPIGLQEGLSLLKTSLSSRSALTDALIYARR